MYFSHDTLFCVDMFVVIGQIITVAKLSEYCTALYIYFKIKPHPLRFVYFVIIGFFIQINEINFKK